MDFYEITGKNIGSFTRSDLKIYNHILENMSTMHKKSVRTLAKECFVSTSTILRLVHKLGFEGYNELIVVIKYTLSTVYEDRTTITEKQIKYKEEYLKNISETIRVLDSEMVLEVVRILNTIDNVYIMASGLAKAYGDYIEFLFRLKDVKAYYPESSYYRQFYCNEISKNDLLIVIDYLGDDKELIEIISKAKAKECSNIISITQANNNIIQNLSDYNFYYFTDETEIKGFSVASNISVVAILELLIHNLKTT